MKAAQSCPTLCDPVDDTVHGTLQARRLEWVADPFSRAQTQVSRIVGRFFTIEPPGKPQNTGVGSLSLLQRIFPTQESNRSLLHGRRILYQLSYEGRGDKPSAKPAGQSCADVGWWLVQWGQAGQGRRVVSQEKDMPLKWGAQEWSR